jgi:polysaccharide biosynthesis transport protein
LALALLWQQLVDVCSTMSTKKATGYKYTISYLTIAKALWNEKILAVTIMATMAAISFIVIRTLPAVYRAEALVLVDSQKIPERFVSTTVTAEVQDRLTTISQEILSGTRLNKVIADFNLYPEQRKTRVQEEILDMMRKDLEVKVERLGGGNRPGAFRISYQGAEPVVVAQVTNRIANLYIEENLRAREVQAEGTTEFIEQQLQASKKQLEELEASVSQYKLQHNGELPQQENALASTLGRLQAELNGVQDSIQRAEQSKILLQNSLTSAENSEQTLIRALRPPSALTASDDSDLPQVAIAALQPPSRVEQLTAKLQTLRTRYSDEHPEVKAAIRELDRAVAEAKEEAAAVKSAPMQTADAPAARAVRVESPQTALLLTQLNQARERTASLRAQMAALDREIDQRQSDRRRILRDITFNEGRLGKLPLREQEMAALMRDYEISKNNYRSLLDKKIAAEMAGDLERRQKAERFTILDPGGVPERPTKPNRPVLYGMSLLASAALGIAAAIAKGLSTDRLLGEWELPKEVLILGRVPRIELVATAGGRAEVSAQGSRRHWKLKALALAAAATIQGLFRINRLFEG